MPARAQGRPGHWRSSKRRRPPAFDEARRAAGPAGRAHEDGLITAHGRRAFGRVPLETRLAHLVLKAADTGQAARVRAHRALIADATSAADDTDCDRSTPWRDRKPKRPATQGAGGRWPGGALLSRTRRTRGRCREADGVARSADELSDGLCWPSPIRRARHAQWAEARVPAGRGRGAFLEPPMRWRRDWLAWQSLGGGERRDSIAGPRRLRRGAQIWRLRPPDHPEDRLEESVGRAAGEPSGSPEWAHGGARDLDETPERP